MSRARRGFSLVEVLIALVILAGAGLVVLESGATIHQAGYANEYELLACIHARTLLSFAQALDFDYLKAECGSTPGPQFHDLDLAKLFEPGEYDFVFAGPNVDSQLYRDKLKNLTSKVRGRVVETDLIDLEAEVDWTIPGARVAGPHAYRLVSTIHRPAAALAVRR